MGGPVKLAVRRLPGCSAEPGGPAPGGAGAEPDGGPLAGEADGVAAALGAKLTITPIRTSVFCGREAGGAAGQTQTFASRHIMQEAMRATQAGRGRGATWLRQHAAELS